MNSYNEAISACTSYAVCGIVVNLKDIDWAAVGAIVLLIARLCKDVPDAYDAIMKRIRKTKETEDK